MSGRTRMGFTDCTPRQSSCVGPRALEDEIRRANRSSSRWILPCAIGVAGLILLAGVMM